MLVLSRRIGQKIMIGDDVSVILLDVRGEHARLGILAPQNVRVDREEVLARRREEADHVAEQIPMSVTGQFHSAAAGI